MEFRVLGPLDVLDGDRVIPVSGRQRSLLGMLLAHANDVVSSERLIDAVWGERPPATAQSALHVHLSQLRKALGAARIETRAPGYRLVAGSDELDSAHFEQLLSEGRPADALALWRGRAYADFESAAWARGEAARLEELRAGAEEQHVEQKLAAGSDPRLLAELEAIVRANPLRERPRGQLMRGLYHAGRQADALALYQETRKLLVEELGIEPGPELQELYRRILNQDPALAASSAEEDTRTRPREERKVVTVLFCDLVRFTSRSEQTDPEDMSALLSQYHVRLRAELERYGGTVEMFLGDAVMAVFGAPVAHEDDAERAVRAALAVRAWITEAEGDLEVRIGISTGEALVRLGASPREGEAMAVGDVVNTAARLQQAAPHGGVIVGEATFRATRERIVYDRLRPVELSGRSQPLDVWLAKELRTTDAPSAERPTTPFVGRSTEMAVLAQLYGRVVEQRSAQLVTIVGEPGIGKTRLLTEFRASVEADPVVVRHGRCLAYGDGVTFWALGEIVKAQAGILETDTPAAAAAKLAAAVEAVAREEDRSWLVSQLAPLVGAAHARGTADQSEAFAAWRTFLEAVAARAPLVLLVEDLHWADAALLEFLGALVEWVTERLLLVTTARPELFERAPEWAAGTRNATTLALAPLSDGDTSAVVAALLPKAALPADTHALLLERAGGNPLYAEEFVRLVVDRGAEDIAVPEGVQAVIAARLDTLPPERKELVHAAAVVGKVFWAGALAAITRMSKEAVLASLHELGRKELVRRVRASSMADDVEYLFWHVLVRDVAYAQIPRPERARMHVAAAAWIERVAGERATDHAEFLAHHYRTALELERAAGAETETAVERAVRWTVRAGDRARSLDPARAARYYRAALDLLPPDDGRRAPILVECADASVKAGAPDVGELEADVLTAVDLYRRAENEIAAADALRVLSFIRIFGSGGIETRLGPIEEALRILERHPPTPELARAYEQLVLHHLNVGEFGAVRDVGRRALELLESLGLDDEAALTESRVLSSSARWGDRDALRKYEQLLERVMNPSAGYASYTAFIVLQNMAALQQASGLPIGATTETLERAVEFSRSRGLKAGGFFAMANALEGLYATGAWPLLLERTDEILAAKEAPVRARVLALGYAARVHAARGSRGSRDMAGPALTVARQKQDYLPFALVSAALAALSSGNLDAACSYVAELEDASGVINPMFEDTVDLARLYAEVDRLDLVRGLVDTASPSTGLPAVLHHHAAAVLHEGGGELERAAAEYADVAERWRQLGYVFNHALSLLGAGRCQLSLGVREAGIASLREARGIFARLEAEPLVAEADAILAPVA